MIDPSRITGLVLAGGRGTRMGSVDKGLEPFDGRPLVSHAIDRIARQVGTVVVSANRHRDRYESFGHRVIADRIDGFAGPLAGLHAALADCATDYLVAVPCDAPFFPLDLVARLSNAFAATTEDGADDNAFEDKDEDEGKDNDDAGVDAAMACTPVRTHPAFCMVRRSTRASQVAYLESGYRSIHGWLATLRTRAVSFADEDAFRNLNTLDQLREARRD